MELFYIRFKGRITGPFPTAEMHKRAKEGSLSRFHEISKDGQIWKKAGIFSDLWSIPSSIDSLLAPQDVGPVVTQPDFGKTASEWVQDTPDPFAQIPKTGTPVQPDKQWHYQQGSGDQCGPLPISVMKNLIQQGDIVPDTLVWADGLSDWTQAQYIPEFTTLF